MLRKTSLCISVLTSFAALAACRFTQESTAAPRFAVERAEIWQPQIELPSSVVVCRSKQCAPAKLSMSKEFIYNSLLHLLDNNTQNKALVCAADSASHVCTQPYLTLPITVGVTPANMYIDAVKISDISASLGNKTLNLLLNYNVTYNGQSPTCKPAETLLYVKNSSNILMEDSGYSCKMTTIGNTTIKTLLAIDYVDLDYGYIGGYYSIGLSGPAYGGGSGYMLLRLPNDAYPLAPNLTAEAMPEEVIVEQTPADVQALENAVQHIHEVVPSVEAVPQSVEEVVVEVQDPAQVSQGSQKVSPRCVEGHPCPQVPSSKMKINSSAAEGSYYNGVEIFPLPPKKKATPKPAEEKEIVTTGEVIVSEGAPAAEPADTLPVAQENESSEAPSEK